MENSDRFWQKMSKSLKKYSETGTGVDSCILWVGCRDRYGYGIKRVTWPEGEMFLERVHRVSYMLKHRILKNDMLKLSPEGFELDVSHLCHNKLCINSLHLALEPHTMNISRVYCMKGGHCFGGHLPPCLFLRVRQFFCIRM